MSAKTSPLNTATTSTATGTTNLSTDPSTAGVMKIKKELPSDEIKEFAETTMNELLGWYGFDDVDRLDLTSKTSRLLHTAAVAAAAAAAATNNATNEYNQQHAQAHAQHIERRRSRTRAASLIQMQQQHNEHMKNFINNNNNNNNTLNCNANRKSVINCNTLRSNNRLGGGYVGASGGAESATSDHDTHSSHEEDSKSPHSTSKTIIEEKIDLNNCCWCRRPIPDNAPEFLTTSDGPRYCSESCFTQSRRASFKKAKTCDWCKHVRHAVSYVDFQDGASQLQFCSDKCLNQYKMQIFCKETQAHLDMNPHLRDQGLEAVAAGNGAGLITPELWLRNCRSRSASPASTISVSPGPNTTTTTATATTTATCQPVQSLISPVVTPPGSMGSSTSQSATHKPLISVAPVAKLMSKSPSIMTNRPSPKHNRKKRTVKTGNTTTNEALVNLKANQISRDLCNLSALGKAKSLGVGHSGQSGTLRASPTPATATHALSQFAGSSVQDLHMSVPPLSPMLEQQQQQHTHVQLQQHSTHQQSAHPTHTVSVRGTSIPPVFFATPNAGLQNTHTSPVNVPHAGFMPRPAFMPNIGSVPRFFGGFPGGLPQHLPPPPMLPPEMPTLNGILGAPPPVTVMVPYPIIIPLPIPIPVPLPIVDFYKAQLTPEERRKFEEQQLAKESKAASSTTTTRIVNNRENDANDDGSTQSAQLEEPLDCSKGRECAQEQPQADEKSQLNDGAEIEQSSINEFSMRQPPDDDASTRASTPNDEETTSPASTKTLHCIVPADDAHTQSNGANAMAKQFLECSDEMIDSDNEAKQKLPKFKITRLQTKRTLIQTKESECSRPLRKRKRIIDCDFQKIALKDDADANGEERHNESAETTVATTECNNSNNNNMKPNNKK